MSTSFFRRVRSSPQSETSLFAAAREISLPLAFAHFAMNFSTVMALGFLNSQTSPFLPIALTIAESVLSLGVFDGSEITRTVPSTGLAQISRKVSSSVFVIISKNASLTSTRLYSLINGTTCVAAASSERSTSPAKRWKLKSDGALPATAFTSLSV